MLVVQFKETMNYVKCSINTFQYRRLGTKLDNNFSVGVLCILDICRNVVMICREKSK